MTDVDAAALRAAQRPVKDRYQQDPAAAMTPLHASGGFADPGVTCTVTGWAGRVRGGLHPATGGDGADACSGDTAPADPARLWRLLGHLMSERGEVTFP